MTPPAVAKARSFLAEAERARDLVMIQMEDAQTFLAMTRGQMRGGGKPSVDLTQHLQLAESRLARVQRRQKQVTAQLIEAENRLEQAFRQADTGIGTIEPTKTEAPAPPPARSLPGDAKGYSLKPDPLSVTTAAELIGALISWRVWAGDISFRKMAESSSRRASASAICAALSSTKLPSLNVVVAVIEGCGGTVSDIDDWATAWRLIRTGKRAPYVEAPPRPPAPTPPSQEDKERWPIRAKVPRTIRSVQRTPPLDGDTAPPSPAQAIPGTR